MTDKVRRPKRGGARPGSGPKKKALGDKEVERLVKAFKHEGGLAGTTAGKELARLAFRSESESIRLKALQCFYNVLAARKQDITVHSEFPKPTIYLPEVMSRTLEFEEHEKQALGGAH
jgi:hypothetical protein